MDAAIIATLWVMIVINIATGWIAYQAAMESRRCRAEASHREHTTHAALIEVLRQLETLRDRRSADVVVRNPFANWVGSALANYEAQFEEAA